MKREVKGIFLVILLVLFLGVVYSYSTATPNPGHTGEDIFVTVSGKTQTLQTAINNNFNGSGASVSSTEKGHLGNGISVSVKGKKQMLQVGIDNKFDGNGASVNSLNPGHDGSSILISVNGVEKTLQQAIDDGDFKKEIAITVSSNTNNLNLETLIKSSGWDGSSATSYVVTINSGVYVGSSNTGSAAIQTGNLGNAIVKIINKGYILGAGGAGGTAGYYQRSPGAGLNGGNAIYASSSLLIENLGTIAGGGGGGGGSSGGKCGKNNFGGGGGGGGAGVIIGAGGFGYERQGWGCPGFSYPGTAGTFTSGGAGGAAQYGGGNGGNGGGLGAAGTSGNSGGAGGAAGNAVVGNSKITWSSRGTVLGNLA
jgi:hypothetical protein